MSLDPEHPERIILSVGRKGACAEQTSFDGSENEDFEKLFYEMYYYDGESSVIEADEWLGEFLKRPYSPVKGYLMDVLLEIWSRISMGGGHVAKLSRPWMDEDGTVYDELANNCGEPYLINSSNWVNNPTLCSLRSLTPTELWSAIWDCRDVERNQIVNDWEKCVGEDAEMDRNEWMSDVAAHLAEMDGRWRGIGMSLRNVAAMSIFAMADSMVERGVHAAKLRGCGSAVPYIISHVDMMRDGVYVHMPNYVYPFVEVEVSRERLYGEDCVLFVPRLEGNISGGSTIIVSRHDGYAWMDCGDKRRATIPLESLLALEKLLYGFCAGLELDWRNRVETSGSETRI